MSIEITLYPKSATKQKLTGFLKTQGFVRTKHVIDELNNSDNIHFMWFDYNNFNSLTGVEAGVMKATEEDKLKYDCSEWILHTRTRAAASKPDILKHNMTIRLARKEFGGKFYNDWYGLDRYIDVKEYADLTAQERGLSMLVENISIKTKMVVSAIESYANPFSENLKNLPEGLKKVMITMSPEMILFNALLPYAVSIIEYFFQEAFQILLLGEPRFKQVAEQEKVKLSMKDVFAIHTGELTIESLISREYNFQNLESIKNAYKKYLNLDIFQILWTKKRVQLLPRLNAIIAHRHSMIHRLEFDYDFGKDEFIKAMNTVEAVIDTFIGYLEKQNGWKIKSV